MDTQSTNSQKCTFFESFHHLRTYKGYNDVKKALKVSSNDANMSIESVLNALQEVEEQKYKALDMTEDSEVIVWFKLYATELSQFIKKSFKS